MLSLTVTLDSTAVRPQSIGTVRAAAEGLPIDISFTTVSARELNLPPEAAIAETAVWGESKWGEAKWGGPLPEPFVIGESQIGMGAISDTSDLFEATLKIISNGSFPRPGSRGELSNQQRHQLRDAMILVAHSRERRDILVSDDVKAFGRAGSEQRAKLEGLCGTRILTHQEFIALCNDMRSTA